MSLKKVSVFILVFMLATSFSLFSAKTEGKRVIKGAEKITIKGTVRHWKDVNKLPLSQRLTPRKIRPVLNFERNRPFIKKEADRDPVVQTSFGDNGIKRESKAMVGGINFAGMNSNDNGSGWPPDTVGDVGPDHYVQAVNTSIGIYDKDTGALISATTFNDFFEGAAVAGTPCDEDNNGDPIVLYDQYAERWFILDFAWDASQADGSYYAIAVSQTSDPTGSWWQYAMRADDTLMNDYPKCGVWHDGIYITANMFEFTGGFQHVKLWAVEKPSIYTGTLNVQVLTDDSYEAFSLMPANAKGSTPPASSTACYMFAMDADEFGAPSTDTLYVWEYDVDWSNPANTTWTGPTYLPTAAFGLTASQIPQPDTTWELDSLYGRLMNTGFYRNFGTYEAAYLCHVVEYDSKRVTRWYEVRLGATPSIFQQGTYAPDDHHRWMASIAADGDGNIALGYSAASDTLYPSIRYAGRVPSDPLGTLGEGEASMIEGGGSQIYISRWGDYSAMTIDPEDDETFWYTQEYYAETGYNWQTRIGAFKVGATDTDPPIISNVVVEATDVAATITWDTNEPADSELQYGLTAAYGDVLTDTALVFNHSMVITGLTNSTTYHFKLISADEATNSAETDDATFTTLDEPPPVEYCESYGNSQADEWIAGVEIGSLSNTSGASPYTDYTAIVGEFESGSTIDVTLTPEHSGYAYTEYWTIWIDFNADGDFEDAGEMVFQDFSTTPVTGTITLPEMEVETRMRVSMKWGSYSSPCEAFSYGEVEDYSVKLTPKFASTFSVFATNSVHFRTAAKVLTGNVGVLDVSAAPQLGLTEEVSTGNNVLFDDGVSVYANRIKLKSGCNADDLYYNTLINYGTVNGDEYTPLDLPLDVDLPVFPTPAPGATDITVPQATSDTLAAGDYANLLLEKGAVLVLTGGTYNFESIEMLDYSQLQFQAASEVIVNGQVWTARNPKIIVEDGASITAKDIVFYVNGVDDVDNKAVTIGIRANVDANFYAPNGTMWLKARGFYEGAFFGLDIMVDYYNEFTLNSAF